MQIFPQKGQKRGGNPIPQKMGKRSKSVNKGGYPQFQGLLKTLMGPYNKGIYPVALQRETHLVLKTRKY